MTWRTFFNMNTMENRHLVFAYGTVLVIQIGYFCRIALQWNRSKGSRRG